MVRLLSGDCVVRMKDVPDGSLGAVVCDPPYGLEFFGKEWDDLTAVKHANRGDLTGMVTATGKPKFQKRAPAFDLSLTSNTRMQAWHAEWLVEAYRTLRPGGEVAAFGGTRTFHRLGAAMDDVGFVDIGVSSWAYGSGFPKSLAIDKVLDKIDKVGPMESRARQFTAWMRSTGITSKQVNESTGTNMASHYLTDKMQPAVATMDLFDKMRPLLPPVPPEIEALVASRTVEVENMRRRVTVGTADLPVGHAFAGILYREGGLELKTVALTTPYSKDAQEWLGWGTALKPGWEPALVGRKPA